MSRTGRFRVSCFLLFGSLLLLAPALHAQSDPMAKWKPNVGDKFICEISHHTDCGDFKCSGLDTVQFEVIDTSYNEVSQHKNAVLAAISAMGLHFTSYAWGAPGWVSNKGAIPYRDTTLIVSTAPRSIATSFAGYDASWTAFAFARDTTIIFQGKDYPGSWATTNGECYVPTLGWFFSLSGYEMAKGGCAGSCTIENWTMALIAAIKLNSSVQSAQQSNTYLFSGGSLLRLVNAEANKITLSDLLGRPVHSWQIPVSEGPREITLNVADVPSGIYFLKLSAPGVEEVRKVVIAH